MIAGFLIVLAAIAGWYLTKPATARLTAPSAIPVRVVKVNEQDVPRYVSGIGSVLSLHSVIIRPQIDGILTKLLVKEGQLVKAGEPLATLDAAQVQLSYTQIRSPVTGRVGIRSVDEGNFLRMADAQGLFSVTQIDPIAVEFSLPQQMLPPLQGLLGYGTGAELRQPPGIAVDVARDGVESLHLALESDYVVIVLDVMLPGLDGFGALRALRARKQTPVMMLTARERVEDRIKGLRDGADDYLGKPFSFLAPTMAWAWAWAWRSSRPL